MQGAKPEAETSSAPKEPEEEESEEEESEEKESEEEDELTKRVPAGCVLSAECPDLDDSLVENQVALKFNVGWELGVMKALAKDRPRGKHYVQGANFDVKFATESGPREVKFTKKQYFTGNPAAIGQWAHIRSV